ncbi:hypothetical protein N8699_04315 [Flavobacteriaceae bacterium]|nr:hypothetical protein [Flavobacteriaceae bacterium]
MKKFITITTLLVSIVSFAQTSIRVINLDVKMGRAEEVAELFAEWNDTERKSGAAVLQGVNYLGYDVTHRVLLVGDPANWGYKEEKSDVEWDAYIGKIQKNINDGTGSMVMTNLRWRDGDGKKNKAHKNWEMIVDEPAKFAKAYDKFIKSIDNILDDRIVALESIDMGGQGGTHNTWLSGSNLNDIILTERAINKTKAFQNFIAERGKVELVKSYLTNNIHVFN